MRKLENRNKRVEPSIEGVYLYEGESLIEKLRVKRLNREEVEKVYEGVYTEKKRGVINAYNIRADRFAIGQERAEQISKYKVAKEMRLKELQGKTEEQIQKEDAKEGESQRVSIKPDKVESH